MNIPDIINRSVPIFKKYPGIIKVELFGSYSKGLNNENSDIDFLIDADDKVFTLRKLLSCNVELENVFERKVDLVYRSDIQDPLLVKSILKSPHNIIVLTNE
jgi:uncharacterized protein